MVEEMVERTPEYFRQFSKQYNYFICRSEPIFDHTITKNFAYSLNMNDDFCKVPGSHFQVIPPMVNFLILSSLQHPNHSLYLVSLPVSNYVLKLTEQIQFIVENY